MTVGDFYPTVNRRLIVKLYPSKKQKLILRDWRNQARFLHNLALEQRIDALKKGKFPNHNVQCKQYVELKQECKWLDAPSMMMNAVLGTLDVTFRRKWKKISGFPRFKSQMRDDNVSMYFVSNDAKFKNQFLYIPKLGYVQTRGCKKLPGILKSFNLKFIAGDWYASLLFECEEKVQCTSCTAIGIDVGLTHFVTYSDGTHIENPRTYEKNLKQLARVQRRLSRRQRGSNRRKKAKLALQKAHHKISNVKNDFLHKLSTNISKSHGYVAVENLDIERMRQDRRFSRSIADASWGMFKQMLSYKCKNFVEVDARYTSQACFECGHVERANRCYSKFECQKCHHQDDADVNAAKNILKSAQLGPTWRFDSELKKREELRVKL